MRASHWFIDFLLFLFCSRRCTPEQSLKAFFPRANTKLVYLKSFVYLRGSWAFDFQLLMLHENGF